MMANMGSMMDAMGLLVIIALVALVLVIAAAVKYLFFDEREKDR